MRKKRIATVLLWLLAMTVIVIVLNQAFGPVIPSWRVERAISRFRAAPSQANAAALVRLLETRYANEQQIRRALSLLLQPEVVTRQTYRADHFVVVSVEHRFPPDSNIVELQKQTISVDGVLNGCVEGDATRKPHLMQLWSWEHPGVYSPQMHVRCAVAIKRTDVTAGLCAFLRKALNGFEPLAPDQSAPPTYEVDFTLTPQINVVPEEEAEQIESVSDPELDQTVRAAFSASSRRSVGNITKHTTASGDRWITCSGQITYRNLPAAVAFEASVRLPDGREIKGTATYGNQFSARAGDSGVFTAYSSNIVGLEQPGHYNATLVLKTTPDLAYRDPRIKTLWSGTLEFPISIDVASTPPPWWVP